MQSDDFKSEMIEKKLSQSYSAINLMRDYLSVIKLNYRNKHDQMSLINLSALLFEDEAFIHLDELLESSSEAIDDALVSMIEAKNN